VALASALLVLTACGQPVEAEEPEPEPSTDVIAEEVPEPEPPPPPPPLRGERCGEPVVTEKLLRYPYLQQVDTDSAIIAWGSKPDISRSKVIVEPPEGDAISRSASAQLIEASDTQMMDLWHAEVKGLKPDTEYCYKVTLRSSTVASGLYFRTAPDDPEAKVRFYAIADFGSDDAAAAQLRELVEARKNELDVGFTMGDNAYVKGTWQDFQGRTFVPWQDLWSAVPIFPVMGNHDYYADGRPYLDNFFLPQTALRARDLERYYSVDWGPIHFVGLDSEGAIRRVDSDTERDMVDWLEDDLKANKDRPWTIASWHHPAFSNTPGRRTGHPDVRKYILPVLKKHGVRVGLTGHNHNYERFIEDDGLTLVIAGGGGRGTYELEGASEDQVVGRVVHHVLFGEADRCTLSIWAVDKYGKEFDRMTWNRCEPEKTDLSAPERPAESEEAGGKL